MCIYKTHSILYERLSIFINVILLLSFSIGMLLIIIFLEFYLLIFFVMLITFIDAIYIIGVLVSVVRNTVDYKVYFFDNYFKVEGGGKKIVVDYKNITNMYITRNYSIISTRMILYLTIECGLNKPIYIPYNNYKHIPSVERSLSEINDPYFKRYFVNKWMNNSLKRRRKNNIL